MTRSVKSSGASGTVSRKDVSNAVRKIMDKRIKFPKILKIAGHSVKVLFPYHFRENADNISQSDVMLGEMRIAAVNSNGRAMACPKIIISLLQEVLYFISQFYCNGEEVSREQLMAFAIGMYQVYADNPGFCLWPVPEQVRIAGQDIKVNYPYIFRERSDVCGQAWRQCNEIIISAVDGGNGFAESTISCNLLHEILHHIQGSYWYKEEKHNERIIEAMTQGLYQVIIDNGLDFGKLIRNEKS